MGQAEASDSSIVSRRVTGQPSGAEQFVMKIPNNKVGLVIGKGGETIKNMQARTGARIQVIPLHLPPGDTSRERTVQIDGTSEQIEAAKLLVDEVIRFFFSCCFCCLFFPVFFADSCPFVLLFAWFGFCGVLALVVFLWVFCFFFAGFSACLLFCCFFFPVSAVFLLFWFCLFAVLFASRFLLFFVARPLLCLPVFVRFLVFFWLPAVLAVFAVFFVLFFGVVLFCFPSPLVAVVLFLLCLLAAVAVFLAPVVSGRVFALVLLLLFLLSCCFYCCFFSGSVPCCSWVPSSWSSV
ncbi:hypothetical protein ACS0TY_028196 [Phlomoides rotata]